MKENHWLHQTKLLIQENGLPFIMAGIEQAVEELAMPSEEFEKLLIKSILAEKEEPREQSDFTKSTVQRVSISEVAVKRYNLSLRSFRCACPFHQGDNKTSLSFNNKTNTFICWSCGEKGNLVHFVRLMEKLKNA